ncbi:MAG: hydrogenase nickel incorporation protein HypA [Thermoproteales archaeon]|nr:hydrogenase nickel incorporation protein HypA [Thermoproteales archaeon]
MHEWSLAEGIYRAVIDFAEKSKAKKVIEIEVQVGELSNLDLELMKEAFHVLAKGSIAENAKINFKVEKVVFQCEKCGYEWGLKEALEQMRRSLNEDKHIVDEEGTLDLPIHYMPDLVYAFVTCPKCGSSNYKVVSGTGISIRKVVIEK